jgi:hypothetical protein
LPDHLSLLAVPRCLSDLAPLERGNQDFRGCAFFLCAFAAVLLIGIGAAM